jgi:hypothetical protein
MSPTRQQLQQPPPGTGSAGASSRSSRNNSSGGSGGSSAAVGAEHSTGLAAHGSTDWSSSDCDAAAADIDSVLDRMEREEWEATRRGQ